MAAPIRIRKLMPRGGLATALPADELRDGLSPRCLNVHFRFGEVRGRPGSTILVGSTAPNATDVLHIGEFVTTPDVRWIVKLHETGFFRWGDTTPASPKNWFSIAGGPAISGTRRWSTTAGEGLFSPCITIQSSRPFPKLFHGTGNLRTFLAKRDC